MIKIQRPYSLQWGIFIFLLILGLPAGCTLVPSSIGTPPTDVWMIVNGERVHVKDRLTMEDFRAMAAEVTEKMLASKVVQRWQKKKWRPLLVVAVPENTTHDANIITEDLQDEIVAKILDSSMARIIDESSVSSRYDYIIKTTITDTVQRASNGSRLSYFTCKLQLFSLRGERIGEWHSMIGLIKAPRSPW